MILRGTNLKVLRRRSEDRAFLSHVLATTPPRRPQNQTCFAVGCSSLELHCGIANFTEPPSRPEHEIPVRTPAIRHDIRVWKRRFQHEIQVRVSLFFSFFGLGAAPPRADGVRPCVNTAGKLGVIPKPTVSHRKSAQPPSEKPCAFVYSSLPPYGEVETKTYTLSRQ